MSKKRTPKKIRCAIYTRKSTEEGLDMEFNSLDAQREACEAYIASQQHEGWLQVPDRYDDGGFSGGNMERPALQRLLRDIEAGRVDCCVVYKIDRLSRSLVDFTKMVELFDQRQVTFVSITQSFNTTTSMGRLTLNVLLSFAQFERAVSSERIRDKFSASRKKGMWMGGHPPLGYDVANRRLVINEAEAVTVRMIFDRFIQIGSATDLARELRENGLRTKSWTSSKGTFHPGKPFDKSAIYRILNYRVYIGDVDYKGEIYPGEHEPIVTLRQWDQAQSILQQNTRKRISRARAQTPFPLKGLIRCGHCHRAMTTSHSRKRGRLYRYYLCGTAAKQSHADCPVGNISAGEIEELVLSQLQRMVTSPELIARAWRSANDQSDSKHSEKDIITAMQTIEPVWSELFPGEQTRLIQLLISRVEVRTDGVKIHLRVNGLTSLADELANQEVAA
ncbi:recombinase family protein [Magnetofaba australis]|uniref:Putative resolvase domain-containing protein n=1 Tax=Magnetofaba australis IT-1 TaxID=1434232 RepID=A0A1Y2KA84_9PROT|nr:recombinase family protein [Magnetofaba australis]OSM08737.1 putative resolvase domain-containing protein [Magnetofaba australis IT-1]